MFYPSRALRICSVLLFSFTSLNSFADTVTFPPVDEPGATESMANFLVKSASYTTPSAGYTPNMGATHNMWYPLSFFSDGNAPQFGGKYWGETVCLDANASTNQCVVHDVEYAAQNNDPYTYHIWPEDFSQKGAINQIERLDAVAGTDIYDAATVQMALALTALRSDNVDKNSLVEKASGVSARMSNLAPDNTTYTDKANSPIFSYGDYNDTFFGGNLIRQAKFAYSYRMVSENYITRDPLEQFPAYAKSISTAFVKNNTPLYNIGNLSWVDWKPFTGENAWANLIGPLQTAYLSSRVHGRAYIPFADSSLQNAIYSLFAFQHMQSPIGALYYAPRGTYSNVTGLVPDGAISTENNASTLAGLRILQTVLQNTDAKDPTLTAADHGKISHTINLINVMIYGGSRPGGGKTQGLLNYFKHYAWSGNSFYEGGIYKNGVFTPEVGVHAVDATTWTLAVLGPDFVDNELSIHGVSLFLLQAIFGFDGTLYPTWGGYRTKDGTLIGSGFSSVDNNQVMSGEWTAGAINALRVVTAFYQKGGAGESYINDAGRDYLAKTQKNMLLGLSFLRSDTYPLININNTSDTFRNATRGFPALPDDQLGVAYASTRYFIPFGWYANPILSTASTSWNIMLDYNYNPFAIGGAYDDFTRYSARAEYNAEDARGAWSPAGKTLDVKVVNTATINNAPVAIQVLYETAPNSWQPVPGGSLQPSQTVKMSIPADPAALPFGLRVVQAGTGTNICNLTEDQLAFLSMGSNPSIGTPSGTACTMYQQ
jgi:hypothetical protein